MTILRSTCLFYCIIYSAIQSKYIAMISFMLSVVPIVNPAKPMQPMITFLNIIKAFAKPDVVLHRATVSKNAGNKMPKDDRANAPTSEMNRSKFGMATAKITVDGEKSECKSLIAFDNHRFETILRPVMCTYK